MLLYLNDTTEDGKTGKSEKRKQEEERECSVFWCHWGLRVFYMSQ